MNTFWNCLRYGSLLIILLLMPFNNVHASPTFSGRNGLIAFEAPRAHTTDIWVGTATTTPQRLVTHASQPRWSPDGQWLAFIETYSQGSRLAMVRADGSTRLYLTKAPGYIETSPAWSADGRWLTFVRRQAVTSGSIAKNAIFVLKLSTQTARNVSGWSTSSDYASPAWSPDGSRLVYQKTQAAQSWLCITNLAIGYTRTVTELSEPVAAVPYWAPQGKRILYNDSVGQVYTIWSDGTHRSVISDGDSFYATWSPNSKRIAFVEHPSDEHIAISESDGSLAFVPIPKQPTESLGSLAWSPDGTQLLITVKNQGLTRLAAYELVTHKLTRFNWQVTGEVSWQAL